MKTLMLTLFCTSLFSFNLFAKTEQKAESKTTKVEFRTPASTKECREAMEKGRSTSDRNDLRDAADTCSATFTHDDKTFYENTLVPRCDAAVKGVRGTIVHDIHAGCRFAAVEFIFASQSGQD